MGSTGVEPRKLVSARQAGYEYRPCLTQKDLAAKDGMSLRTYQRFWRVVREAPELAPLLDVPRSIGTAERMVKDPALKEWFLRWVEERHSKGR